MASPAATDQRHDPPIEAPGSGTRDHAIVVVLVVAAFVVILNETIMGVALPRLMRDLSITAGTAQWLTSSYLLTMAVVIPITGFLLQRLPVRTLFVGAMLLFSLGTTVAALSPSFALLLSGRVLQACGTAVMMPMLMTTVLHVVPAGRRGQTMGLVSVVISVAPAIGPTVSGFILSILDWRWLFWAVLPLSLGTLVVGLFVVRNVTTTRKVPLDVWSVMLAAVAFGGLVYGLSSIGESISGHATVPSWVPLTLGGLTLVVFIARQFTLHTLDRALLDLRTFADRPFAVSVILMFVVMTTLFGVLILLPLYLQNVLGVQPVTAGLVLLPGGLLMGLLAPVVGALFDRYGARRLVVPAALGMAGALWWMTTLTASSPVVVVMAAHVCLSGSLAFMFTPLFTVALGSLRPQLYSHGSAIMGTVQQLAGAVGTAMFITAMTVATASASSRGAPQAAAQADGFHVAMLIGACLASVGVLIACCIDGRPTTAADAGSY